jgi:naphthoate synthase
LEFCSEAIKKARGHQQGYVGEDGYHRPNILEVQRLIRFMPKQLLQLFHIGQLRHTVYVVCDLNL